MPGKEPFNHVFLSFKGETRDEFTCFLYEALQAEGIEAFLDRETIHVGDEIGSTIREGIRTSMSAIIVFSPNYAYSKWCLDELVLILERMKSSKYFVMPIFYDVKVEDVKYQLGNYGRALESHMVKHEDKVERWREALKEIGKILGVHVEGLHSSVDSANSNSTIKEVALRLFSDRSIFIRRVVKSFRENWTGMFPEQPLKNRVTVYARDWHKNSKRLNWVKKRLREAPNVVYAERSITNNLFEENLSENMGHFGELLLTTDCLDLDDEIEFPCVVVNGKILGAEQVKGLEHFEYKPRVILALKSIHAESHVEDFIDTSLDTVKGKFIKFWNS